MLIKSHQEMQNEIDMLRGNINRMCVADSIQEVFAQYEWARKRLEDIFNYNISRLERNKRND